MDPHAGPNLHAKTHAKNISPGLNFQSITMAMSFFGSPAMTSPVYFSPPGYTAHMLFAPFSNRRFVIICAVPPKIEFQAHKAPLPHTSGLSPRPRTFHGGGRPNHRLVMDPPKRLAVLRDLKPASGNRSNCMNALCRRTTLENMARPFGNIANRRIFNDTRDPGFLLYFPKQGFHPVRLNFSRDDTGYIDTVSFQSDVESRFIQNVFARQIRTCGNKRLDEFDGLFFVVANPIRNRNELSSFPAETFRIHLGACPDEGQRAIGVPRIDRPEQWRIVVFIFCVQINPGPYKNFRFYCHHCELPD